MHSISDYYFNDFLCAAPFAQCTVLVVGLLAVPHCLTGSKPSRSRSAVDVAVYLSRDLAACTCCTRPRGLCLHVYACVCVVCVCVWTCLCKHLCMQCCCCSCCLHFGALERRESHCPTRHTMWLPACDSCQR